MSWVYWATAALILYGIRSWLAHRISNVSLSHQKLQLVSIVTTLVCSAVVILYLTVEITPDQMPWIAGLGLINGLGFLVASLLGMQAQQFVPLSFFQSVLRLRLVLPIPFAFVMFGEAMSLKQWSGIVTMSVPLLVTAALDARFQDVRKIKTGLAPLGGALLALSGLKLLDAIAVKTAALEPVVFLMATNIFAALFGMLFVVVKRDAGALSKAVIGYGTLGGLLNFLSLASYLMALRQGPASAIIPLVGLHVFVAQVLDKAFPSSEATRQSPRFILLRMGIIGVWLAVIIALLVER